MRQGTYLNVILTVNAVLLAGLVWTQVADTPLLAQEAAAQNRTAGPPVPNVPNAGKQRERIAAKIMELKASVDETRSMLESGRVKVEVTNLDEVELTID